MVNRSVDADTKFVAMRSRAASLRQRMFWLHEFFWSGGSKGLESALGMFSFGSIWTLLYTVIWVIGIVAHFLLRVERPLCANDLWIGAQIPGVPVAAWTAWNMRRTLPRLSAKLADLPLPDDVNVLFMSPSCWQRVFLPFINLLGRLLPLSTVVLVAVKVALAVDSGRIFAWLTPEGQHIVACVELGFYFPGDLASVTAYSIFVTVTLSMLVSAWMFRMIAVDYVRQHIPQPLNGRKLVTVPPIILPPWQASSTLHNQLKTLAEDLTATVRPFTMVAVIGLALGALGATVAMLRSGVIGALYPVVMQTIEAILLLGTFVVANDWVGEARTRLVDASPSACAVAMKTASWLQPSILHHVQHCDWNDGSADTRDNRASACRSAAVLSLSASGLELTSARAPTVVCNPLSSAILAGPDDAPAAISSGGADQVCVAAEPIAEPAAPIEAWQQLQLLRAWYIDFLEKHGSAAQVKVVGIAVDWPRLRAIAATAFVSILSSVIGFVSTNAALLAALEEWVPSS